MDRLFRVLALGAVAIALAGCTTDDYRYKLTLTLDTPDGPKTAFNVVAMHVFATQWGVRNDMRGEALYVDMGEGRRPLVALLTAQNPPFIARKKGGWAEVGPYFLGNIYRDGKLQKAPLHDPHEMLPDQLPDLVTFSDVNDPSTAIAVDPEHLEATLGSGVSWRSLTIELTDEPATTGIAKKLPWLADNRHFWQWFQTDPRYYKVAEVSGGTPHSWTSVGVTPGMRTVGIKDFVRND
jgi:hypothetical protein